MQSINVGTDSDQQNDAARCTLCVTFERVERRDKRNRIVTLQLGSKHVALLAIESVAKVHVDLSKTCIMRPDACSRGVSTACLRMGATMTGVGSLRQVVVSNV